MPIDKVVGASGTNIIVLDGEERVALAVVRSLVRAGYAVTVMSSSRWGLAAVSRGVARKVIARSNARSAPADYAKEVIALAQRISARVVLPLTDSSAEAILERRGQLPSDTIVPFADLNTYRLGSDKIRVHELASEVGLGIDESEIVERYGDPAPSSSLLYPGVVKPHKSVFGTDSRQHAKVRVVMNRSECEEVLRAMPAGAFPVLVQRRVRGPGEGFFSARWRGVKLARFAHRRLREKPASGGASVFRESIDLDPAFAKACEALLDKLGWEGVAMVECKRDLDRGGWRLIEINGRFWGSLQLAIDAGVDFPTILTRAVLGEDVNTMPAWIAGIRLRWEWGDVDHLAMRLRYSRERLALPLDAPGRLAAIGQFLSHRIGTDRLEVMRLRDPVPFVVESLARFGVVS